MLSNLKVFTDKVYKKMKRLIEETDDHDLQDLKQAFKAHNNKYVLHFSSLPLFSLPTKPLFTQTSSGQSTPETFKEVMQTYIDISDDDLNHLIKIFDPRQDGWVNHGEFVYPVYSKLNREGLFFPGFEKFSLTLNHLFILCKQTMTKYSTVYI